MSMEAINFKSVLSVCLALAPGTSSIPVSPTVSRARIGTSIYDPSTFPRTSPENPSLGRSFQVETVRSTHVGRTRHAADRAELVRIDAEVLNEVLAHVEAQYFAQNEASPARLVAH